MSTALEFRRRWWLANSLGFGIGLVVFSLLGHGVTGAHGDELTAAQYLAHTAGFAAAAALILAAQRAALKPLRAVTLARAAVGVLVCVLAFWFGTEVLRPPADWILGFTVLAMASWIRVPTREPGETGWSLAAIAGHWGGICVALFLVMTWDRMSRPDEASLVDHTTGWFIVGATTGIVGGYLSGWAVSRILVPTRATPEFNVGG